MSFYAVMKYPDVFGKAGVFSPSLWVSEKFYKLTNEITDWEDMRIFIQVGDQEGHMDDDAKKLYQALLDAGMPSQQLVINIEKGFGHSNLTWQRGFKIA